MKQISDLKRQPIDHLCCGLLLPHAWYYARQHTLRPRTGNCSSGPIFSEKTEKSFFLSGCTQRRKKTAALDRQISSGAFISIGASFGAVENTCLDCCREGGGCTIFALLPHVKINVVSCTRHKEAHEVRGGVVLKRSWRREHPRSQVCEVCSAPALLRLCFLALYRAT